MSFAVEPHTQDTVLLLIAQVVQLERPVVQQAVTMAPANEGVVNAGAATTEPMNMGVVIVGVANKVAGDIERGEGHRIQPMEVLASVVEVALQRLGRLLGTTSASPTAVDRVPDHRVVCRSGTRHPRCSTELPPSHDSHRGMNRNCPDLCHDLENHSHRAMNDLGHGLGHGRENRIHNYQVPALVANRHVHLPI